MPRFGFSLWWFIFLFTEMKLVYVFLCVGVVLAGTEIRHKTPEKYPRLELFFSKEPTPGYGTYHCEGLECPIFDMPIACVGYAKPDESGSWPVSCLSVIQGNTIGDLHIDKSFVTCDQVGLESTVVESCILHYTTTEYITFLDLFLDSVLYSTVVVTLTCWRSLRVFFYFWNAFWLIVLAGFEALLPEFLILPLGIALLSTAVLLSMFWRVGPFAPASQDNRN